jgi:hypothetical protein
MSRTYSEEICGLHVLFDQSEIPMLNTMMKEEGKLQRLLKRYYNGEDVSDDEDDEDGESDDDGNDDDLNYDYITRDITDENDVVDSGTSKADTLGTLWKKLVCKDEPVRQETTPSVITEPAQAILDTVEFDHPERFEPHHLYQLSPETSITSASFYTAKEQPIEDESRSIIAPSKESTEDLDIPGSSDTMRPHVKNEPLSIVLTSPLTESNISRLSTEESDHPRVRFNDSKPTIQTSHMSSKSKGRILQLKPTPELKPLLHEELHPEHSDAYKRVKSMAKNTKVRFKNDVAKYNQRKWFKKFMMNFETDEIIKAEKMLVLLKSSSNVRGSNFASFTEQEPCDTRVVERWKEYIVVARSTGDLKEPILIQFYTSGEIPHKMESRHGGDSKMDATLTRACTVNFYSPLDRTIALVKENKIYIMRCQSPSSSIHWLTFFNSVLGIKTPSILKVEIPKIKLSLNLNLNKEFYQEFLNNSQNNLSLVYKDFGYHLEGVPAVEYLGAKIKERLRQAGFSKYVNDFEGNENLLGFCWRYYDRLEWLFGETLLNLFWEQAMHLTHELELRVIKHYPRFVEFSEVKLDEPTPIEGFLLRLTTKEGHLKRGLFNKQVFTFEYFFTNQNLLFFKKAYKALPPLPYSEELIHRGSLAEHGILDDVRESLEPIYNHNPYALDKDGHVQWLHPGITEDEFRKRDLFAFSEFQRRVTSISRAGKLLNIQDMESVEVYDPKDLPVAVEAADRLMWGTLSAGGNILNIPKSDSYFKLIMKNGSTMVLKAQTTEMRNEWVARLNYMKQYWALRLEKDNESIRDMKEKNISELHIDHFASEDVCELDSRWEMNRGIANADVYSITPLSMFRPVLRSGYLYQKPKKHSSFKKYFVTLVPGRIILYNVFVRDFSGFIKPTTHYSRYLSIPLQDCYIYSGSMCLMDLLDRGSDAVGTAMLPRVYEDGWLSSEDEGSRCFTLWFGKKRAIAGKSSKTKYPAGEGTNPGLVRMVSRLGVTGKSMVFMCRSRQERDLWLTSLYIELERFGKANKDLY